MGDVTWAAANVPTMWISAQAADTQMAWEQVGAWSRAHELLLYHESRLKMLQIELSDAWPPSRSSAATAFVQYIDGLLVRVARARHDADKNRVALQRLLESLSSAKKDIAPMKAMWDKYEAEAASRAQNLSNSLPHSGGSTWQEDLNAQARARMIRSDNEVFEASQTMVVSDASRVQVDGTDTFDDDPSAESSRLGEGRSHPEVGVAPSSTASTTYQAGSLTQLAGNGASGSVPPGAISSSVAPLPNGADTGFGRGPQAIAAIPVAANGLGPSKQSIGNSSFRVLSNGAGSRPLSAQGHSTAPPAIGIGGQRGGSRVSPVGGVISPGPTGVAGVPPVRASGPTNVDERAGVPVPTFQWEVACGGVPIIEPPVEEPFELGPGVIGIDR